MQKVNDFTAASVQRLIEVDPDKLIEAGHRLKQAAMDSAYPGDSVTLPFTADIWLVYHPEREFLKPNHKTGGSANGQAIQGI